MLFSNNIRLKIDSHTVSHYFKGQAGTTVIMASLDSVPISGVIVETDYYKPDNTVFLSGQGFTEIENTGVYFHNFDIPIDADEGIYKLKIHAVYEIDEITFDDDFSENNGVADNWEVSSGNWEVENHIYKQTREGYTNRSLLAGTDSFNWVNYSFECDIRWDSNKTGILGLIGKYLDSETYYSLEFNPDWGNGELILRRGSSHLDNANYMFTYPTDWIKLKMVFDGHNIKCYIDNILYIDYNDGSPIENGKPALYTSGIKSSFDNIHIIVQKEVYNSYQVKDFIVEDESRYRATGFATSGEYDERMSLIIADLSAKNALLNFLVNIESGDWVLQEPNSLIYYLQGTETIVAQWRCFNIIGEPAINNIARVIRV